MSKAGRRVGETAGIAAVICLIFQGPLLAVITFMDNSYLLRHYHMHIGLGIFLLTYILIVVIDAITAD